MAMASLYKGPLEQTAEFHIMTDGDADGVYLGITHQPIIAIVANVAHHHRDCSSYDYKK